MIKLNASSFSPLPIPHRNGHNAYTFLGAHPVTYGGLPGWHFRVWAPNAISVSVVGSFNYWDVQQCPMKQEPDGFWSAFVPNLHQYDLYQFSIQSQNGERLLKADPYAFHADTRPCVASKLYDLRGYEWGDCHWMAYRRTHRDRPINVYQVHLSSWRRTFEGEVMNYRGLANFLVPYVKELGFTHVMLLPVMEHPLDSSFGYQATGYFAATSRLGTPTDLMYLIDQLHQAGIGVILDGIPGNTPADDFGLCRFDGSHCYEQPQSGGFYHAFEFDYTKPEVCEFLASSAFFWVEQFHVDGLCFTRCSQSGEAFLSSLHTALHDVYPDVLTIGLGGCHIQCDLTLDIEWTGGMLSCLSGAASQRTGPILKDGTMRPRQLSALSRELITPPYASIAGRIAGDDWTRFSTVRGFYLVFLSRPGHKLTMMGTEFGQWAAWQYHQSLDWHLLQYDFYQKQQHFFRAANAFYLSSPTLWGDGTCDILYDATDQCLAAFARESEEGERLYIAANFGDRTVYHFPVSVSQAGTYQVRFSSDCPSFGGHGQSTSGTLTTVPFSQGQALMLTLAPGSAVVIGKQSL